VNSKFTGGNFSYGYIAEHPTGRTGFVKALDFSRAHLFAQVEGRSIADVLNDMTNAYIYERDLLLNARDRRLSKVVVALAHGEITLDPSDPLSTVYYLIFEEADGDIRKHLSTVDFDVAWNLRALHHIATGTEQVHRLSCAHQDIKPSNILVFDGVISKLSDFGCAASKDAQSPRGGLRIAGDPAYAPPELLYHFVPNDWATRRIGCDLYHLGNMAVFLFCDTHINALIFDELPDEYHPNYWAGTYFEVLPFLKEAFAGAIELIASDVPDEFKDEFCDLIKQLCHPDPQNRGWHRHRRRNRNPFTVEPFVGRFDLLASKAEKGLFRHYR
jgi:serine/threonine protein kinase